MKSRRVINTLIGLSMSLSFISMDTLSSQSYPDIKMNRIEAVYFSKLIPHMREPARILFLSELYKRMESPEDGVFCDISDMILVMKEEKMLFNSLAKPEGFYRAIDDCSEGVGDRRKQIHEDNFFRN